MVALGTGKRIENAGLKEQCYEDYFYGKDTVIEDAFAQQEGKFDRALGDLSPKHLEALTEEQVETIRFFMHYQSLRTLGAAEEQNSLTDAVAKSVLSKDTRFADVDLSKVSVKSGNPQLENLYLASETIPLTLDLEIKFLVSDKKLGFVLSDHPVLACNSFAENHPVLREVGGSTGLALKGLQRFLPVSPRVCIALYDPTTYVYGSPARRCCKVSLRDIRILNALQAATAHECVYFDPDLTPADEVAWLLEHRAENRGWREVRIYEGPVTPRSPGMTSQIVAHEKPSLRVGRQFEFLRVIDSGVYAYPRIPPRSPELVQLTEQYQALLRGEVEKKRQERERAAKGGSPDGTPET